MKTEIFINGTAKLMRTIKSMQRIESQDGDPKKDIIHILYEPSGAENAPCTMENLIGLVLWQAHKISGLESTIYSVQSQLKFSKEQQIKPRKSKG